MRRPRSAGIALDESPPESDRLEGFRHPRETQVLFGHGAAERDLAEAVRVGRLHHAWLITGPEGIGKATLAYRMARVLLAAGGVMADKADLSVPAELPGVSMIAALSHPNLLVLRRPWQEQSKRFAVAITIDEVRRLKDFLGLTPGTGRWRVIIVDRAEDMNASAANALLKSLEEPPAHTIFLLICAAPGRLPATIRSRCRTLHLQPLGREELTAALRAALAGVDRPAPEQAQLAQAVALAGGSVRHGLELLAGDGVALYGELRALLATLPRLDYDRVHRLADNVAGRDSEARFELLFTLLEDMLPRLIRHQASGAGALTEEETALAGRLLAAPGLARWAQLWEEVRRAKADALALNLDRKSLVLGTFFRLEEAARASLSRPG